MADSVMTQQEDVFAEVDEIIALVRQWAENEGEDRKKFVARVSSLVAHMLQKKAEREESKQNDTPEPLQQQND